MQLVDVVVVLVASLALLMGASDATAVQAALRAQLEMGLGKPTRYPTVPRPRSAPTVPAPTYDLWADCQCSRTLP